MRCDFSFIIPFVFYVCIVTIQSVVERLVLVPYLKLKGTKLGVDDFFLKCKNLKSTALLAHPAGVEPPTLSAANFDSGYTGTDCNK